MGAVTMVHLSRFTFAIVLSWHGTAWSTDPAAALQSHNQVRSSVSAGLLPGQPAADPPLPLLSWDPAMAVGAADHARRCLWEHADNLVNTGENLAFSTDPGFDIRQAVSLWADEYRDYDFANGQCTGDGCGHYTQLVWQSTLLLGCGEQLCETLRLSDGSVVARQARLQVCRYAAGGNIAGVRPYSTAGEDPALLADFSDRTGVLRLPYALVWQPNNVVLPVSAAFALVSTSPIRFELSDVSDEPFRDNYLVNLYDARSSRLFVSRLETLLGGERQRYGAVLRAVPGTAPLQIELEYFR